MNCRYLCACVFSLLLVANAMVGCGDDGGAGSADPNAPVALGCETSDECGVPNTCSEGVCVDLHGKTVDANAVCEEGICGPGCAACSDGTVCVEGLCTDSADTEVCPTLGMPVIDQTHATYDARKSKTIRHLRATSREAPPWDEIEVTLKEGTDFEYMGTGVYDLGSQDYATCSTCVVAQKNCHEGGCVRQFFAKSGTLVIEEDGGPDGQLTASLYGVLMEEVYIDAASDSAIVMPTGSPWCLPEVKLTAQMVDITQESACDPEGDGNVIGKKIANFQLTNCLGLVRDLHDGCGDARAFWFIAVAGW